jgi:hypothetical protein
VGRKKIEDKKVKISITIDEKNDEKLNGFKINKSKLINWLLLNYFSLSDI